MHSPWFLFFLFIFALWLPFYTFCRAPALHPATPFEKGVDPKTFLRMATYFSWKGKEPGMPEPLFFGWRSMDSGCRDLWAPVVAPSLTLFAGPPPCTRRPLLKKGSIRKLYLRTGNILFMEGRRIRYAGAVFLWEPIYGLRSPSPLWVFCALVHGGRHLPKALGFSEDASHLHDLKRPSLFRRDEVPARNTNRSSGFAFMPPKSFWGFQGAVFQKRSLAGCGTASHKRREQASASEHAFSGGTKSLHETSTDCPASPSRT